MLLKDKRTVITGASRGIGLCVAEKFLQEGASVILLDIIPCEELDRLRTLTAEGATVEYRQCDVSSEEVVDTVIKGILDDGPIDVLVNNAGITRDGPVFRMPLEDWQKVLTINLTSAFMISKQVARAMFKQRSGSIINMASVVGVGGNAYQTNYSASKAGLIGFSRSLAKEVAGHGVRVNSVAPGYIITDMTAKLPDKAKEAFLTVIPMNRGGEPDEVAKVVLFLASDLSSYVTGQVIRIDGGMAI